MSDSDLRNDVVATGQRPTPAAKCLVVIGTLVICLVMLEVGLRIVGRYPGNDLEGYWEPGGVCYRLKKNASKMVNWPTTSFSVFTSDMGFRYKRPGPRAIGERPYYAVLGSSEIFGNGLDYEKTLIGVFAEKMEREGVDIINMAVGGHGFDDQSTIFKQYTATAKRLPAAVLICLNPLLMENFDEHHEDVAVQHGYLFPKDHWQIAYGKTILENKCSSYCFFRDTIRNAQLKFFNREDYDLSFYFDVYSKTNRVRTVERQRAFLNDLKDLEDYIRKLNARPVCVFCPTAGGFMLNTLMAEGKLPANQFDTTFFAGFLESHCRAENIQFVNLEPAVQELHAQGKKLNIELDGHFNAPTSQVIGDYLYETLRPGAGIRPE